MLFSGTVRRNLDLFGVYTDAELRAAWQKVHLIPGSKNYPMETTSTLDSSTAQEAKFNIFESLSARVSEGGLDFSQGQWQLFCLARSIVIRPKIMILDEATSVVDKATDALIQRSIQQDFSESTLLVVAHRLATVAEFDNIFVMGDGKAVEFGTPRDLIGKKGAFWQMVCTSGDKEALEKTIFGGEM